MKIQETDSRTMFARIGCTTRVVSRAINPRIGTNSINTVLCEFRVHPVENMVSALIVQKRALLGEKMG